MEVNTTVTIHSEQGHTVTGTVTDKSGNAIEVMINWQGVPGYPQIPTYALFIDRRGTYVKIKSAEDLHSWKILPS